MSDTARRPQWTQMARADFEATAPNHLPMPTGPQRIPAAPDAYGTQALFGEPAPPKTVRRERSRPQDTEGQGQLFGDPESALGAPVSTTSEALLQEVRAALHRRSIWAHAPDKERTGWHAQPTVADGIPSVTLTWRGVKVPDYHAHMRQLSAESTAAGALVRMERILKRDFIVGRLFEPRDNDRAGQALVALLIFQPATGAETGNRTAS